MTNQGNGYIMCKVHHGIGSSKKSPKEHFERNPHVSEDKVKGEKSIRSRLDQYWKENEGK